MRLAQSPRELSLPVPHMRCAEVGQLWLNPIMSNVFKAGHRMRLEISSSNFPRFDRNPNTGGALATETTLLPALQTIHHDGTYPSHVTLPIIPRV